MKKADDNYAEDSFHDSLMNMTISGKNRSYFPPVFTPLSCILRAGANTRLLGKHRLGIRLANI